MKKIFVCSPFRGDQRQNEINAEQYCKYVHQQGHVPFAPHLFFTRFLNDDIVDERRFGIMAGMEFLKICDEIWVFGDVISEGMRAEIRYARENGIKLVNMSKIPYIDFDGV